MQVVVPAKRREENCTKRIERIKGELSGLKQFFATKSPLKMMKNAFYFT